MKIKELLLIAAKPPTLGGEQAFDSTTNSEKIKDQPDHSDQSQSFRQFFQIPDYRWS